MGGCKHFSCNSLRDQVRQLLREKSQLTDKLEQTQIELETAKTAAFHLLIVAHTYGSTAVGKAIVQWPFLANSGVLGGD